MKWSKSTRLIYLHVYFLIFFSFKLHMISALIRFLCKNCKKRPLPSTTCFSPRPAPFPSLWLALVNFEPNISRIYTPQLQSWASLLRCTPMKMERLVSSETSALKGQTPGDYPKDTIRHSTHGGSLKSRLNVNDVFKISAFIGAFVLNLEGVQAKASAYASRHIALSNFLSLSY